MGRLQVQAGLFVDPLSMTMVLFVTGVSTLIHLYSIGYMKGDRDYPKFFLYMNLFVASMLILVLGSNLLVTFVGWEGVGACSYWLVAFWFTRESAASAGKKAFIYNRIGDVGFLLAIFLIFDKVHSLDYPTIFANLGHIGLGQHHRHLPPAAGRGGRQVGPDPAVPVAGRRHGGPDPGVGPHPRRHHGDRRRLPAVPGQPAAPRLAGRRPHRRHHRRGHRLRGRHHRLRPGRHQEGAGLLDGLPARLHVPGHRVRVPTTRPSSSWWPTPSSRGCSSSAPARSSTASTTSRTSSGWATCAVYLPDHLHHLRHRLAGHRRRAAAVRLLGQGRRPRERLGGPPGPVGGRDRDRRAHRLLHEPPHRAGLLRQRPLVRRVPIDADRDSPAPTTPRGPSPSPTSRPGS